MAQGRTWVAAGATVAAYDPEAHETARIELQDTVTYSEDMYSAVDSADALVLVTEWPCFRRPNFGKLKERMRGLHIFDGRNIWDPVRLAAEGFVSYGIGRPRAAPLRALAERSSFVENMRQF